MPKSTFQRKPKRKFCQFCADHQDYIDYKDVNLLRKFMSDRGKIRARRVTGNCAQHQRDVAIAIKTARELALLPYTQRTVSERGPGRGGRGGGRPDRDRFGSGGPSDGGGGNRDRNRQDDRGGRGNDRDRGRRGGGSREGDRSGSRSGDRSGASSQGDRSAPAKSEEKTDDMAGSGGRRRAAQSFSEAFEQMDD